LCEKKRRLSSLEKEKGAQKKKTSSPPGKKFFRKGHKKQRIDAGARSTVVIGSQSEGREMPGLHREETNSQDVFTGDMSSDSIFSRALFVFRGEGILRGGR